eukprot:Em0009g1222a
MEQDPLNYNVRLHPKDLAFADSNGKVLSVLFDFKGEGGDLTVLRKSMRTLYLVVDGGWYYSSMEEFLFPYHAYVPLSVFGEYFLVEELEMKARLKPAPFPRSYCQDPVSPRLAEHPLLGEERDDTGLRISVDSIERHSLERGQDFHTVQISLVADGWGNASMALPPTVDVLFEGKRVTVALPAGEIRVERGYGQVHIPVKRELVYDVRERVYHYSGLKMVPLTYQPTFYRPDKYFPSYRVIRGESVRGRGGDLRSLCVEFYDPTTRHEIAEYIAIESEEERAPNALNKTDYALLKHMEDVDWRRQLVASRVSSAFSPYLFEGYGHGTVFPTREDDLTECRRCPPNSRRGRGRGGLVYHCAELGTFYNLLTPVGDSQWTVSYVLNVAVVVGGQSQNTDLTASDRIPHTLKDAVRQYSVLVPPLGPWGHSGGQKGHLGGRGATDHPVIYHALEDAIYVPTDVVNKRGCGGLKLYMYPKNFSSPADFCERDFGDCIGEPFHSPKRFPVIPPFGLAELAGPVPTHWFPSEHKGHPLKGAHLSSTDGLRPRAVLVLTNHRMEDGAIVLSYSPKQVSIGHVTVQRVKLLEPILEFRPWQSVLTKTAEVRKMTQGDDFCNGIWKLEPMLHNTSHETEAILLASAFNSGEGGGTVVFEAKCTGRLIVTPASGRQMVWVPPHSGVTSTFHLNAIKTSNFIAVHTCHLSVTVETISSFPTHHAPWPLCTRKIRTFGGAFENPCSYPRITPPHVELQYYVLPADQRRSSEVLLRQFFTSPGGRGLTLIRAITLVLIVPKDEKTLKSLYEVKVSCGHRVTVLHEDQLFREALLSRRSPDHKLPNNITFSNDFLLPRRLFYFGGKEWVQGQSTKPPTPSGCHVEVWVRIKPFPCKHIERSLDVFIPLSSGDIKVINTAALTSGKYWFLTLVYGDQREEVLVAMTTLALCSIIAVTFIGTGKGMMYILRTSVPTVATLRNLERKLEEARRDEKRRWENPEIYLSSDQLGPFYHLYDFRATDSFDTASLQPLKIAGTLKYKDKELQVLFGHISKIYLDDTKKSCDLWVEASSGMYLLEYSNVDPEYKATLTRYLMKYGIMCP